MRMSVLQHVADIFLGEVVAQSLLNIFDLATRHRVVIVVRALIDEVLVQGSLQQIIEISEDASVVPKLILLEDCLESMVHLILRVVILCLSAVLESGQHDEERDAREAPESTHCAMLSSRAA